REDAVSPSDDKKGRKAPPAKQAKAKSAKPAAKEPAARSTSNGHSAKSRGKSDGKSDGNGDARAKTRAAKAPPAGKTAKALKPVGRETKTVQELEVELDAEHGEPARKPKKVKPGSALVVVESPAKARTIGKYLGSGFTVKASVGHVRDLPKSKIGV